MPETTPKFRREPAARRRETLIEATLSLIAEEGVQGATVRAIATRAQVTQGLIRHHFSSKDELVLAAYEAHMRRMTGETADAAERAGPGARARLAGFVTAALGPPVVDGHSVALWAGFLTMVRGDTRMRRIHEETYRDFRDRLEVLIGAARREAGCDGTAGDLRSLAIASNAVLDGLWMEGGALPDAFAPGELPAIGLAAVGAIIGLDLAAEGERS